MSQKITTRLLLDNILNKWVPMLVPFTPSLDQIKIYFFALFSNLLLFPLEHVHKISQPKTLRMFNNGFLTIPCLM
jgi:hypothetical protein